MTITAEETLRELPTDEGTLRYHEVGDGPPLLLLRHHQPLPAKAAAVDSTAWRTACAGRTAERRLAGWKAIIIRATAIGITTVGISIAIGATASGSTFNR